MIPKYSFIGILFPVLLLCQLATAQQSVRTIFLVRHAEKASAAPDAALSAAGEKRADCLAKMLKEAGIKQIYVTDAKSTQDTATALGKSLKVTSTVLRAKDTNTLIRDLLYAGGDKILVVGDSDTLPFVLARLKAGTVPPIAKNEYDRMFVVTLMEGAASPASTLRYCDCGAGVPRSPGPSIKQKKSGSPANKQ